MKKKWLTGICVMTCVASLLAPSNMTMQNRLAPNNITYAATTDAQYNGTYTVPVTSTVGKNDSIASIKKVSFGGSISDSNTEDVYLLNVQDAGINLEIQGAIQNLSVKMELQTLAGNTLKSCILNSYSDMIDTTTGTREDGIYKYYLAKGQYLCKISKNYGSGTLAYKVNTYSVDASETKSVSLGKKYISYAGHAAQYKKITVKEAGKLTIKSNEYNSLSEVYDTQLVNTNGDYFTLCNAKKKELTSASSSTTSKCYGVKKGTYYIKMSRTYYDYRVYSVSFKKAGTPTNTKRKTAKTVTKKLHSYVLTSESSATQWYKFTVKKAKKMKFYINNQTDGDLRIEVQKKGERASSLSVDKNDYTNIQRTNYGKVTKWEKGTYYVKITKYYTSNTGGIVQVKLK